MTNASLIEIRTFCSPEEIRELPAFIENNPVTQSSYKRLIGDYHFGEMVCCCVERENGTLCLEPHKRGWVAELLDGSATLIGNRCAEKKFGADSRLIADQSRYLNEKRRRERTAAILLQIETRAQRLDQLAELRASLQGLQRRVNTFTSDLSEAALGRLRDIARREQSVVTFNAVKIRVQVDKDGRSKKERSKFEQSVGQLKALDLVWSPPFFKIYDAIKEVARAHEDAERLGAKPRSAQIDAIASRLNDFDRILKEGKRLLDLEPVFFANNFLPLCFLDSDKTERFKAARIAMRRSGVPGRKEEAKAWLAEQERAIKEQLGIDVIEIR